MHLHVDDEQILTDRVAIAVDGILSGNNTTRDALRDAVAKNDRVYFEQIIRPVMRISVEEAAQLRQQRDYAQRDAEAKRFALERVAANVAAIPSATLEAIKRALPGHPLLKER